MRESSTQEVTGLDFRKEVQALMRARIREAIQITVEEELAGALGCEAYERSQERRGYRNGTQRRRVTTANGLQELDVPRGRLIDEDGNSREFRSEIVPRYARRTLEVDEAILGAYLAGANTRRIRKALSPLLGEAHLSKSAISRVVGRLKVHFQRWCERDLSERRFKIAYLDGFHVKVRLARRVVSVPVLAAMGVAEDGRKVLLALRLAASEAGVHWKAFIEDLKDRGLSAPALIIADGHKGLAKATELWPETRVQRCTQHKWQNLVAHCPAHARAELKRDWDRIIYAADGNEARSAYRDLRRKWSILVPAVARSLEEAGLQLLTFYEFPKSMWKSLRSTNALENLNREFRRRTKTQGSFSTEAAAVTLLWGLIAFGQIQPRRIVGYKDLPSITAQPDQAAA
jgi:transposase-like protein|tara:strand:- start:3 stop:1208 length:1206 start_codon:yes stop_codon:yes gene_type:complete